MSLEHHYHDVRERLRNGYGSEIKDTGIVAKAAPKPDASVAIFRAIEALERRVAKIENKMIKEANPPVSQVDYIIRLVCLHEKILYKHLVGQQRQMSIVRARQMVYYLACKCTERSTTQIGRVVGNRDHSTVIYGRECIEKQRLADGEFNQRLAWYEKRLSTLFTDLPTRDDGSGLTFQRPTI